MSIIGLTGHSGSGKTTVAAYLQKFGYIHIDCDKLVHNKIYTDPLVLNALCDAFGSEYIINGTVNRKLLSKLVFSDKNAYNKLMNTIRPFIVSAVIKEAKMHNNKMVLLDAPTLFEFSLEKICDKVIGVVSDNAVERICTRDGIDENLAIARLKSQKDADFYKKRCDYIIENNGDLAYLEKATIQLASTILKGN